MARKRMIDPGIWDSEQVQSLTAEQFKLYIYMISQADDDGRCKVCVSLYRARVHPLNNYSAKTFKADIEAVAACGLMRSYFVDGEWFMFHPHWKEYQYIQKPKPSKLPVPEEYNTDTVPVQPNRIELNRIELNIPSASKKSDLEKIPVAEGVRMTPAELEKLKAKFPDWEHRINKLSLYKCSKGKQYKSDYHAILSWAENEPSGNNGSGRQPTARERLDQANSMADQEGVRRTQENMKRWEAQDEARKAAVHE